MDILIVPPAGFDRLTGRPTESGSRRLNTAIWIIKSGMTDGVAIIGGKRFTGDGEADLYYDSIGSSEPDVLSKVKWLVDASATCTNRDLLVAKDKILDLAMRLNLFPKPSDIRLGITSYKEHMERAAITLQALGFQKPEFFDSGEKGAYGPRTESILTALTRIDPTWSWFPPALLLVKMANRRLTETLIEPPK